MAPVSRWKETEAQCGQPFAPSVYSAQVLTVVSTWTNV